jgi:hypothetical protein
LKAVRIGLVPGKIAGPRRERIDGSPDAVLAGERRDLWLLGQRSIPLYNKVVPLQPTEERSHVRDDDD